MPCIIFGAIKINSVATGSNVQFGDAAEIALTSTNKMYAGNNSFSPGDSIASATNGIGNVNTNDPDVVDAPNTNF